MRAIDDELNRIDHDVRYVQAENGRLVDESNN